MTTNAPNDDLKPAMYRWDDILIARLSDAQHVLVYVSMDDPKQQRPHVEGWGAFGTVDVKADRLARERRVTLWLLPDGSSATEPVCLKTYRPGFRSASQVSD